MKSKLFIFITLIVSNLPLCLYSQTADELMSRGRKAYMEYKFDEAANLYAQARKKAKKTDSIFNANIERYSNQLSAADNYLNRVEQLVIIDSISVPRYDFFKHYRIPVSAGTLGDRNDLPFPVGGVNYVFSNEGDDYKLWSQPDSLGNLQIVESSLLTDGSWSEPTALDTTLSEGSDAVYPFLMSDGVTLYYADNGENSIGGYDIMVATRDATDGSFLQPSNLGFPYNSPYDDFLLAIDELNGIGWWATDRNSHGEDANSDELTIYVFMVNDLRQNYPADTEDIISKARIDDYLQTQPEDGDYEDVLSIIRAIEPGRRAKKAEFNLPARNGKVYHRYDELPDSRTRSAVKIYFDSLSSLEKAEKELQSLRKAYHNHPTETMATRILEAEKNIEIKRNEIKNHKNSVYEILDK